MLIFLNNANNLNVCPVDINNQEFFKAHPQYVKNEFYITGESYAGHYIPAFAARVHQGNKNKDGIKINLKVRFNKILDLICLRSICQLSLSDYEMVMQGFAIGNGLTDPEVQYKAYTDYALDNGLIKKPDYNRINKLIPACEQAIKLCGTNGESSCLTAYTVCNNIFNNIMDLLGNKNVRNQEDILSFTCLWEI